MINKVAIITGASRGLGRAISLGLAKNNYNIVVAAKSVKETKELPGSIYTVSKEIEDLGSNALPIKTDLMKHNDIENLVEKTINKFGRIDVVINNAGALWWKDIENTPIKRYDLINNINSRASFYLSRLCIPHMEKNDSGGHIIMQSPPLSFNNKLAFPHSMFKNKTAYMISKLGMTMTALGIAEEYKEKNIAANTLWPMTPIESYALINNNLGTKKMWRKQDIIVDSINNIIKEDPTVFSGNQLIDEQYLKSKGITDFTKYQCVPGFEPPKMTEIDHLWKN
jgi:citronellol/citronellal dehydrogenase